MFLCAAEKYFINDFISERFGNEAHILTYGIIDDELSDIIDMSAGLDITKQQILSGLLNTKKIIPISTGNMLLNVADLSSVRPEYAGLAIKCNSKFLYSIEMSQDDVSKMGNIGVSTHHSDNIDFLDILELNNDNKLDAFNLVDGGNLKLSDHALRYVRNAKSIKIYDRYFSIHSADALSEVMLEHSARHGLCDWDIVIYVGSVDIRKNALMMAQSQRLQALTSGTVSWFASDRINSSVLHIHDRYMQVDENYTLCFSAGLGCYVENNGLNRACSVDVRSIIGIYETINILDGNGNVVGIRY